MIATFDIRDRGATPAGCAKRINVMKKVAWEDAAILFHSEMRDSRFSKAHARAAGYASRKHLYTMRKLKVKGHTNPLQWSGTTRRAVRAARISTTSNSARVAYAGARVLNFRNPKSQVKAAVEFSTITKSEADAIAQRYDTVLDRQLGIDDQSNSYGESMVPRARDSRGRFT
jgi:hypothetical protein